jgi:hypothetical protein
MIDFESVSLVLLCLLGWLWFDSIQAREVAVRTAQRACESAGLQFLDETVSCTSLRPVRDEQGKLRLRRIYFFEYSETGDNRRRGGVTLLGQRVEVIDIGLRLVNG